jgi:hypothetical protein
MNETAIRALLVLMRSQQQDRRRHFAQIVEIPEIWKKVSSVSLGMTLATEIQLNEELLAALTEAVNAPAVATRSDA